MRKQPPKIATKTKNKLCVWNSVSVARAPLPTKAGVIADKDRHGILAESSGVSSHRGAAPVRGGDTEYSSGAYARSASEA